MSKIPIVEGNPALEHRVLRRHGAGPERAIELLGGHLRFGLDLFPVRLLLNREGLRLAGDVATPATLVPWEALFEAGAELEGPRPPVRRGEAAATPGADQVPELFLRPRVAGLAVGHSGFVSSEAVSVRADRRAWVRLEAEVQAHRRSAENVRIERDETGLALVLGDYHRGYFSVSEAPLTVGEWEPVHRVWTRGTPTPS